MWHCSQRFRLHYIFSPCIGILLWMLLQAVNWHYGSSNLSIKNWVERPGPSRLSITLIWQSKQTKKIIRVGRAPNSGHLATFGVPRKPLFSASQEAKMPGPITETCLCLPFFKTAISIWSFGGSNLIISNLRFCILASWVSAHPHWNQLGAHPGSQFLDYHGLRLLLRIPASFDSGLSVKFSLFCILPRVRYMPTLACIGKSLGCAAD